MSRRDDGNYGFKAYDYALHLYSIFNDFCGSAFFTARTGKSYDSVHFKRARLLNSMGSTAQVVPGNLGDLLTARAWPS